MKPTFLGIGAQKCASSWLYEILRDHPQVVVSSLKELDYFSYRYENGHRWYEAQFETSSSAQQVGEVSPSYLHEPAAAQRAYAYQSSLRILVSLRDPVERALSQHRHMVRLGLVPGDDLSFETALATNPTYVEQGDYLKHLQRWQALFGRDRLHVVLTDDVQRDPGAVASALYRFLSIEPSHISASLGERKNVSYVVRHQGLEQAKRIARRSMSAVGAERLWRAIGDSGLRSTYRRLNRMESAAVIPPPRPETLLALRRQFAPGIDALARWLDRDLVDWLEPASVEDPSTCEASA